MEHLFNSLEQFYPQCKKYFGCFTNRLGQTEFLQYNHGNRSKYLPIEQDPVLKNILPYRKNSSRKTWLSRLEDPVQFQQEKKVQLDIGEELERNILVLSFESHANYDDVLILYLDSSLSQFGITRSNRDLRQDDRLIIATLLKQTCDNLLAIQKADRKLFSPLSNMKSHLQSEMQTLQNQLDHKDRTLAKGLEDYTDHILDSLAQRFKIEIKLTKRAYEKIGRFNGKFTDLENSLEESISIAVNSSVHWENELILDESDLFLKKKATIGAEKGKDNNPVVGRLTKTHQLLDRYEEAARQAQRSGDPVIGRIIGSYCNPSISNAAITDSLNNHSERIWELMAKYPDKWPVIRNNFRSVINLITRFEKRLMEGEQNAS